MGLYVLYFFRPSECIKEAKSSVKMKSPKNGAQTANQSSQSICVFVVVVSFLCSPSLLTCLKKHININKGAFLSCYFFFFFFWGGESSFPNYQH